VKINLHIYRLVLDGLPIEPRHGALVKAAVETELGRLLAGEGLADSLLLGGAMPSTAAPPIEIASDSKPLRIGEEIGRAIYGGIGK
jgi:hypothetical protein